MPVDLVKALGPAFAAGFALQQGLEILDALILGRILGPWKKALLSLTSLFAGLAISGFGDIYVLKHLGYEPWNEWFDFLVTGLIISAGTEGLNSLLKFLNYKKEEQKAETAIQQQSAGAAALATVNQQPSPPVLNLPTPAVT